MKTPVARRDARIRRFFNGFWYAKNNHGFWYCEEAPIQMMHRAIWTHHCGPITRRHRVLFKDGNRDNVRLRNLRCVRTDVLNPWRQWQKGLRSRPVDRTLGKRNNASRRFWRSMTPAEREIYCLFRGLAANDAKRDRAAQRARTKRFFQMTAAATALAA